MANAKTQVKTRALPDWWQRENQRRQLRVLILLVLLLMLIGFFYYVSRMGVTGAVGEINFDTNDYIAFVRQDKDGTTSLYGIRADGTDLRRLTDPNDRSLKRAPAWTIDGKSLLYSSNRNDSQFRQLYILGEGEPRQLTYGKSNKDNPVASPDGRQAGYVSQGAVKTVNLNGTDVYQIMPVPQSGNAGSDTEAVSGAEPQSPFLSAEFSSDGRGIAGVQELSADMGTINVGGSVVQPGDQVARAIPPGGQAAAFLDTGHEVSVAWDPKGTRLADTFTEIEANGPDGKKGLVSGIRIWEFKDPAKPPVSQLLFVGFGYSVEPKNIAWSPDGTKIAFEGWRLKGDGVREPRGILVLPSTVPSPVGVTPETADKITYMLPATPQGQPQRPRWSPDGARLVFEVTRPDGGHDLWVVGADGSNLHNLTNGVGDNTQAAWSPAKRKE